MTQLIEQFEDNLKKGSSEKRKKREITWADWIVFGTSPHGEILDPEEAEKAYKERLDRHSFVVVSRSSHFPIPRYRPKCGTIIRGRLQPSLHFFTRIQESDVAIETSLELIAAMLIAAEAAIRKDIAFHALKNERAVSRIQRKEMEKEYGPGGKYFGEDPKAGKKTRQTGKTARKRANRRKRMDD